MGSAADLLSAYGDDSSSPAPAESAPLTVNLARPAPAASPFPSIDQPLGAQPHDSSAAALHALYSNDNKDAPAKQPDAPGSTLAGSAVQGAVGLSEAAPAAAGMPGDIQSMGNSALDRFSNKAIHYLAKTYQENWQGKPWTDEDEKGFKAYEDLSNPDTGIVKPMANAALGPVGGAVLGSSTLPTSEQTLQGADALRQSVGVNVPQPQGTAERYSRNIGMAVPLALDPAAGAAQMVKGAITQGAIPAVAATATADAIDDPATKQVASFVAGGVAGHAPHALARTGSAIVHSNPVVGALDAVGIKGPAQSRAGERLLQQAENPQGVIDQLQAPPNPNAPAGPEQFQTVPGSTPTTFQLTGDQGLGAAQRGDATKNAQAYKTIEEQQNAARQAHTSQIEPEAHADALATHLGDRLSEIHTEADKAVQAAKDRVPVDGTTTIEPGAAPEVQGDALQSHLADLNAQAKSKEGALHQAVDPHGVLVSSVDPIDTAMQKAYGSLSPTAQGFISPVEQQFSSIVQNYGPTIPYRELGDLSSQIAAAMRQERMSNGSTPTLRRLSTLMDGVKDAMATTARQVAHTDAQGVKAGVMDPQNTLAARLTQTQQVEDAGNAGGVSASNRAGVRPSPAAAPEPAASPSPAGGATGGSDTPRPSDSDVAGRAAPASGAGAGQPQPVESPIQFQADPKGKAPQRSAEFIARREANASAPSYTVPSLNGDNVTAKVVRNADGSIDYLMTDDGQMIRSTPDSKNMTNEEAVAHYLGDHGPNEAPDPSKVKAVEQPGIRFEADPEVQARQKAANAATVDRYKRFGEGPVGQVLAPGKRAGEFRTPAASVPDKLFRQGPSGYTATKAYFDAAGPEGAKPMHDVAIGKLANIVSKDGGLTEAGLMTWRRQFGDSLRAIDEATPGFSSRFDNTAKALDEVERTTAEQKARVDAYQKGVVGDMLGARGQGDEAVTSRLSTIIRDQKNGVAKMRELVGAAKDNPDAMAGLRKGVADALAKDLETKTKEGASDVNALRPAGSYRAAVDRAAPTLREVLTPEQLKNYYDVADDLDKTQRSITGNKLKNSSNTAQDTHAAGSHGAAAPGHGGITTTKLAMIEAATLGGEHLFDNMTHSIPMSAQVASAAVGAAVLLRKMGINSVQKYYSDALQHPDRAAIYVKAFTSNPNRAGRLNGILRKSFINQHKAQDDSGDQGPNEPPPSGPFSPNGRDTSPPAATAAPETNSRQVDERGRVEPTISPLPFREPESGVKNGSGAVISPSNDAAKSDITPESVSPTGRQARVIPEATPPNSSIDQTGINFLDGDKRVFAYNSNSSPLLGDRVKELDKYQSTQADGAKVWYKDGQKDIAREVLQRFYAQRHNKFYDSGTVIDRPMTKEEAADNHRQLGKLFDYGPAADSFHKNFMEKAVRRENGHWVVPYEPPKSSQPIPGNVPLAGRQARILLADGHTPDAVRTMDHGARAAALQDAMSRGVEPVARIRPGDRESLGGAMPHPVHAGRSADGRFSEQPGGLEPTPQAAPVV